MKTSRLFVSGAWLALGCSDPQEPPKVEVPVVADSSGIDPVVTNLGYEVRLTAADVAIRDIEFTVAGEVSSSLWQGVSDAFIPRAWAHPGHYQGGDVTGELLGSFVLHFKPGELQPLGTATLLAGNYRSVNFFFDRADAGQLEGHTGALHGVALQDEAEVEFSIILDSPEDRQLVGAQFETRVEEGSEVVAGLRLLAGDPFEDDTLFDDVDFFALDEDSDGRIDITPDSSEEAILDAYNQIHRRFQSHDHFDVQAQD